MTLRFTVFLCFLFSFSAIHAQEIALLKYQGGGDWYSNPTSLPNLIKYCNQNIHTNIKEQPVTVTPDNEDLFQYPFIHMTGHGNVFLSDLEAENLRKYLLSGGFLHIDDNYGMNNYIRKEIKKIFPYKELEEIPASHPIFSAAFAFPNGLPKIHEHDGLAPQAFGIFDKDRLILIFTFESDLGDGWEDPAVHNDIPEVRTKALQMGANIIKYAFEH
ncbi:DUF4159 domain-containing protein [Gillisia sp. M10.2A]|uniref:DUF4159 domain-containing protein n=1 Tax=Gillisia lutea TaxID=2909668 RepID=A0ABS9EIK5_9FLAO|nr:DUF4159 domain-containing protein [Gillisia lutea]MCF4101625.1 DUF4159 domain-containing protein [Gillisia lutea]